MKFLELEGQNFEEYFLDIRKKTFSKLNNEEMPISTFDKQKFGFVDLEIEQKGEIVHFKNKMLLKQDVLLSGGMKETVMLFFNNNYNNFSLNKKTEKQIKYSYNTHGIRFFNNETNDCDVVFKDTEIDLTSLNIPISYFERLVNLYPNLFERSFLRYKKGESFFLNDTFTPTTSMHYNILLQIGNSHLMGNCSNAYIDAKVLELLSLYFNTINNEKSLHSNNFINSEKIKEAEYILISDMNNPPSVKELSLKVGLNPNLLREGFKKVFNNTIYGYLFEHKMQLAMQLLQETSLPIVEIAFQCGYEYASHFCTAFKRMYSVSPSSVR